MTAPRRSDERVLVLAPSAHDGPVTEGILRNAGFECTVVPDVAGLCAAIESGAGAALVAQEALTSPATPQLSALLERQAPWSDIPVIIFTGRGRASVHAIVPALAEAGNMTLLERPVETITLVSAVRAALRARRRQYAARSLLVELRESMERHERQVRLFEGIASSTPDFVYLFDLEGRYLYANRRLLEVWGMQLPDIVGKTCRELGYEQWHHDMHMREIAEVIATKRPIKGEVPFKAALTGVFGVYEYIFTPVVGPGGAVEVVAGTTRDVTDRKTKEEALRDADRRKDDFLSMLSHELRNPLAPIRNSIDVLRHADAGSERVRRAHAIIDRQTEHLTRLVDDLLDVTRIARGKIELRRQRVDLRDLVVRAADDLRPIFTDRELAFHVAIPPERTWAQGDATRILQVVGNLLHNAAKFTHRGDEVTLSLRSADGYAEIAVRDTGAGLEPDLLRRVFDPFVQGERTLARTEGGLGLGLALVKGIVELHDGTVRVHSEGTGRGAEFTVRLPLAPAVEAEHPPRTPVPRPSDGRHVLVVDDNRDAARSLAELLELRGHRAEAVFDGPTAVEKVGTDCPDAVLCDIGLPGMTGYEVAKVLRGRGLSVRLIAVTGYAQPDDVRTALEAGFDSHVAKPCDPDLIEQLIG